MKKKIVSVALVLMLALSLVLSGCAAKYDFMDKDVSGYITLGTYKGVTANDVQYVDEITDADVNKEISTAVEKYSKTAKLGKCVVNDATVVIDSAANVDGTTFTPGTVTGKTITIGKGELFSAEVDKNLLYAESGATVDFKIVIPSDYSDAGFAGKTADFSVTVKSITDNTVYKVEDGDTVNINFSGVLTGQTEPFEGGTGTDYDLEIGSNSFISGFETGLIGKASGSTVDLNLTFPADYSSTDLAGKAVVFTVTINYITRTIDAELTDTLVSENSSSFGDCKTAAEYRAYVLNKLNTDRDTQNKRNANYALWKAVVDGTTFTKEPSQVKSYYRSLYKYWRNYAAGYYSMSLKEYVEKDGKTLNDYKTELMDEARATIKEKLVLAAIAQAENLKITDADYEARLESYYNYFEEAGYNLQYADFAAFKADLEKNGYFMYLSYSYDSNYQMTSNEAKGPTVEQIKNSMQWDKVMEFISANATVNWAK